jgi:hypothetical protein
MGKRSREEEHRKKWLIKSQVSCRGFLKPPATRMRYLLNLEGKISIVICASLGFGIEFTKVLTYAGTIV